LIWENDKEGGFLKLSALQYPDDKQSTEKNIV
jgi:hypothetical protein